MTDEKLIEVYTYLQIIMSTFLAIVFGILLIRNCQTYKFKFVTVIASLVTSTNLAFMLQVLGYFLFLRTLYFDHKALN